MPTQIGENLAKKMLKAHELVLCMGVNQRLGVRYLTGGSDVGYILSAGRADVKQLRELKL
jgi:hypothetical protein